MDELMNEILAQWKTAENPYPKNFTIEDYQRATDVLDGFKSRQDITEKKREHVFRVSEGILHEMESIIIARLAEAGKLTELEQQFPKLSDKSVREIF